MSDLVGNPKDRFSRDVGHLALFGHVHVNKCYHHGGNSKGTTCVVDRDVTAYLVVDRVLRFPTEQYGCRYGGYPG